MKYIWQNYDEYYTKQKNTKNKKIFKIKNKKNGIHSFYIVLKILVKPMLGSSFI